VWSRKEGTAETKREISPLLQFRPNPTKCGIFKAVTKTFKAFTKCGSGQMDLRILSRISTFHSEAKRVHPTYASSKDDDLDAVMQLFESECGLQLIEGSQNLSAAS
jgi:hypothetical protein